MTTRLRADLRRKIHAARSEDARVHRPQLSGHLWAKPHEREDVALDIQSWRDFDQLQTVRADTKHRAFGDEKGQLAAFARHLRVVANLFELRDELLVTAFVANDRLTALPPDIEIACGERASENHAFRVLADVDESSDADDPVAEAADIDVPLRIDFRERQESEVKPAAIVEIE